jgi:6-pyruvoyltetrahydropterin/6-carboxytetrahydropterin synthase
VPPFDAVNPSSENLARYIWNQMAPSLPETVKMYSVTVAEKGIQSATYMEEE